MVEEILPLCHSLAQLQWMKIQDTLAFQLLRRPESSPCASAKLRHPLKFTLGMLNRLQPIQRSIIPTIPLLRSPSFHPEPLLCAVIQVTVILRPRRVAKLHRLL